jgi:hypothetical protein
VSIEIRSRLLTFGFEGKLSGVLEKLELKGWPSALEEWASHSRSSMNSSTARNPALEMASSLGRRGWPAKARPTEHEQMAMGRVDNDMIDVDVIEFNSDVHYYIDVQFELLNVCYIIAATPDAGMPLLSPPPQNVEDPGPATRSMGVMLTPTPGGTVMLKLAPMEFRYATYVVLLWKILVLYGSEAHCRCDSGNLAKRSK